MNSIQPQRGIKRIIFASLIFAMLVDFIPLSSSLFDWLPEFTALTLLYWLINRPHYVGLGTAFIAGLFVDIGVATPLGQHALAYICSAWFIERYHKQIITYDYGLQAVMVLAALMANEIILTLVQIFTLRHFDAWLSFISPFIGALLWPVLNRIMLNILNFRRFQ